MILTGRIRFKDVLGMLAVDKIPGCDDEPNDWIDFIECVDIDNDDIPECELCDGEGIPEQGPEVDPNLIRDFVRAIKAGDMGTAQCLVGRVFAIPEDIQIVDQALRLVA
jgi:hypothetical protein